MGKIMIVVASHDAARIFEADAGACATLLEREDLLNPSGRRHRGDLESDRQGSFSGVAGGAGHALGNEQGQKEEALARYVRSLAVVVNAAHHTGHCERIYLVADPHVLGALREDLDAGTRAAVAGEVVKNLVKHTVAEIRQHLPERL
ncbi:MAG TPA: host attachment protein [Pseudomonadales bacterium]|nr:host attachment protein [Pseudomonadales bacterium]